MQFKGDIYTSTPQTLNLIDARINLKLEPQLHMVNKWLADIQEHIIIFLRPYVIFSRSKHFGISGILFDEETGESDFSSVHYIFWKRWNICPHNSQNFCLTVDLLFCPKERFVLQMG